MAVLLVVLINSPRVQCAEPEETAEVKAALSAYDSKVKPIIAKTCTSCHGNTKSKGKVNLELPVSFSSLMQKTPMWLSLLEQVEGGNMPPEESKTKLSKEDATIIVKWVRDTLAAVDSARPKDPGFVMVHRLNRTEYNNTIRDLTGITDFKPADDFPADDSGYGFDNIADVLSMSPLLGEKYMHAAEDVVDMILKKEASGLTPQETKVDPKAAQDLEKEKQLAALGVVKRPPPVTTSTTSANATQILTGKDGRKVFVVLPSKDMNETTCAETILRQFAYRAYRRPAKDVELQGLMRLYHYARKDNKPFEHAVGNALTAILVSPQFLFRSESKPLAPPSSAKDNPLGTWALSDYEIATRLSYFLWSSMPDDELYNLARDRKLKDPKVRADQVARMLKDPRSGQLIENFAGQWLELRNLDEVSRDPKLFPNFNPKLAEAMYKEAILFFDSVAREDKSIITFLDADYTFVNDELAKIYGLSAKGSSFERVSLKGTPRGGVVTMASTMTLTANPARTSPVKRGKWVLEQMLGTPPPPPPPDVPTLDEKSSDDAGASLRQRLEKHRQNPVCASCHNRMDGLGFALENFDSIGRWRSTDGKFQIEASGELPDGTIVKGAEELKKLLIKKQDAFVKTFIEKMMIYALGRGIKPYDRAVVMDTLKYVQSNGNKFSAVVTGIVNNDAFTMRREKRGDE